MHISPARRLLQISFLLIVVSACGGNENTGPAGLQAQISSVSPSAIQPSASPQTLVFEGVDFRTGMELSVVAPDGTRTSFREPALEEVRSTSFQVSLVLNQIGVYGFQVETPDGRKSGLFSIVVQPVNGTLPTIASVSPATVTRSQQPVTIAIMGRNFNVAAEVLVTTPTGVTSTRPGSAVSYLSSTRLDVTIVFDAQGVYSLAVRNPSGDTSNGATVTAN